MVRADNPLYLKLEEVKWDLWNNWEYKESWFNFEKEFQKPWNYLEIWISYNFVHRRDPKDKLK